MSVSTTPSSPYRVCISALRTPPTGPMSPFKDAPHLQEALDAIWDRSAGRVPGNRSGHAPPFPLISRGAYQSVHALCIDQRSFRSSGVENSYYYGPLIPRSLPMQDSVAGVESASDTSQHRVPASFRPACTVLDPRHCIPTAVYMLSYANLPCTCPAHRVITPPPLRTHGHPLYLLAQFPRK